MSAFQIFESRIAVTHRPHGAGGGVMDVRHEEFMAMADALLGPHFDRVKLAQVEQVQLALHDAQASLARELDCGRIERARYVDEVNQLHVNIAQQCESILGRADFLKLFGVAPFEVGAYIDKEEFLAQA